MMPARFLEVKEYKEEGYKPVIDYGEWRVAQLNYIDELETEQIDNFHRHHETDEVFVLLEGECILFLADDNLENIHAQNMEKFKMYNVKKGAWHTHTLTENAKVLIVENRDTGDDNSDEIEVDDEIREKLTKLKSKFWNNQA